MVGMHEVCEMEAEPVTEEDFGARGQQWRVLFTSRGKEEQI